MARTSLVEDIFEVLEKDPDGKVFEKVSRFKLRSDLYEMDCLLDVNVDIYPMEVGDKFSLVLASTLNLDGTPMSGNFDTAFVASKGSLMDKYEYVVHGKVFKFRDRHQGGLLKVEVTISFGGLLMQLIGDVKKLESLELDTNIFLLLRKV